MGKKQVCFKNVFRCYKGGNTAHENVSAILKIQDGAECGNFSPNC